MPSDIESPSIAPAVSSSSSGTHSQSPPSSSGPTASPSPSPSDTPPGVQRVEPTTESVLDSFNKQFSDLDDSNAPPPPAKGPKPTDAVIPKAAEPDKSKTPEAQSPAPQKAATGDEDGFDAPQSGTLLEVRQWGKRMAAMAKNATSKAKELTAKVQELEERGPQVPPDIQRIQNDYARLQQENQELRSRQAQSDYASSPEYEQQFLKPYRDAYLRGRQIIKNLHVREQDESTGGVTLRPGTAEDFDKLFNMTDSEADEAADKMFGPSARRVIAARDAAKEKAEGAYNAVREKTQEHSKTIQARQAQAAQQRLALQGLWKKVNDDLQTKHEKWFGNHDGDTEWNDAIAKGREIAQQRFAGDYMKLAPEQRVVLDAQIFNRASAFPALRLAIARLEADRDQYKKDLETLRGSSPGKPATAGPKASEGQPSDNWEQEFDKKL